MPDLRYTLQFLRPRELRWRTARSYGAEREDWRVVLHTMGLAARKWPAWSWRIVLMPFNVLAASVGPLAGQFEGEGAR